MESRVDPLSNPDNTHTIETDSTFSMRKLFWEDPYQNVLKATVHAVNGNEVLLDATIVYHFSGGQASDRAVINGMLITSSRFSKDKTLIYYTLPANHGLKVGDPVTMEIDWACRNRLMRLHFACEMVLEIVTRLHNLEKTGANMEEHKARVDFKYDGNIKVLFADISEEFERVVAANLPIVKGYKDKTSQHRFWRVDSFWGENKPAQIPCGGTHVNLTSEIGRVEFKRKNGGKSKPDRRKVERIEITLKDDTPIPAKNEPIYFKRPGR